MKIALKQIQHIVSDYRGTIDEGIVVQDVFIDSRKSVKKGLFVPIVGERFDGHDFLMDAITQGAIAALWEQGRDIPAFVPNDFPLFYVEDTVEGMQAVAKLYLQSVRPKVVAITGSNGKTTTKDFVDAVLKKKYTTHKTAGNYNNHIGLPLTIFAMPPETEVLILEMGMNDFGEISLLSKLAQPDVAMITNIGDSHLEKLKTREGIAKAKLEILDGLRSGGTVFIDGDEPLLTSRVEGDQVVRCGFGSDSDVLITDVTISSTAMTFSVARYGNFTLETLGKHHAKNATYAIALAGLYNIPMKDVQEGLQEVHLTGMRFEMERGRNGVALINDAYNASPTSMKAAIETLKALKGYKRYVVVLGDMYELGEEEEALHRSVAHSIDNPVTHVVAIGEKAAWIADECERNRKKTNVHAYANKDDALETLETLVDEQTIILFKSSRKLKLETIISQLKQ